ncbi:MAG: penicillin-binding protein 1C [Beggiatoa sp. IS2]|nr:MAG: penicillin-binding protein 1C [Beggiatoa sp. IS2]
MRLWLKKTFIGLTLLISCFIGLTILSLAPPPQTLSVSGSPVRKTQLLDRQGTPLTVTYQNDWNLHDQVKLHEIPEALQHIFVIAEDKRFFEHHGADWLARSRALIQNLMAVRVVRGASTITEQTVRMLHPRPRTFWSRWLEGFEAMRLEQYFSKADILEFYLNQVPYASQRRGVVQAARYYFGRDLTTLNLKEMIVLAVLVRSPTRLDLHRGTQTIEKPVLRLAQNLYDQHLISAEDYQTVVESAIQLQNFGLPLKAAHFVNYLYTSQTEQTLQQGHLLTTLDAALQSRLQELLNQRITDLHDKNVMNGAVCVVDHLNQEILAWVNAESPSPEISNSYIDAITSPRQPGSTLKPFLYALALEKGWTAATLIDDAPLTAAVGAGMHRYRNYSRSYYGPLRLRDVLGNSLNTPAIRTIQFVGVVPFLQRLQQLGMSHLTASPEFYGDGLALGNGGVTLFELVQAYTVLANQGQLRPLKILLNTPTSPSKTVLNPQVSSLIADILSDADARRLEFGQSALLRFPVQTAIKTGTSTDYRDAWAVGFNYRYTAGVWLGNLDQQPMSHISGSTGSALVLRAIFAELNRYADTQPLVLDSQLIKVRICQDSGQRATADCPSRDEWFIPGTEPDEIQSPSMKTNLPTLSSKESPVRLQQPTEGLQLALDPRIPDEDEAFAFVLSDFTPAVGSKIEWLVNGEVVNVTTTKQYLWPVQRGTHLAQARIWEASRQQWLETPEVTFYVK